LSKISFKPLIANTANNAASCAVTAVGGAAIGDEEEDAVGIAVDEAGCYHGLVFAARIAEFFRGYLHFFGSRNDLAADWVVWIGGVDEVKEVGGDGYG
jgi:hypothetical protein